MQLLKPLLFVLAVLAAGLIIGYANVPGDWYAKLAKPWFNPPNWIFAPVWSILYVVIGLSAGAPGSVMASGRRGYRGACRSG